MNIKNYTHNFYKHITLFLLLIAINIAHKVNATCNAGIYNTSSSPFLVQFTPDDYDGDVYFINIDPKQCPGGSSEGGKIENVPCIIYPHQVVKIDYTTHADSMDGVLHITNMTNESAVNIMYGNNGHGSCPKFDTIPNYIVKDSPSDGFLTIKD